MFHHHLLSPPSPPPSSSDEAKRINEVSTSKSNSVYYPGYSVINKLVLGRTGSFAKNIWILGEQQSEVRNRRSPKAQLGIP
ncbi:hypothetical protein C5167_002384 [Papaver somniferum]|uniref:Uncharacterized protein n=1 Tax=Papaver somniferum TaxID=3469 RepID=A0A4Y7L0P8_PAPSO|nr:hypothetical protein C5167_002384 [Papaver somniferum]